MFPYAAAAFAVVFLVVEHFNGGIKTHHFLARADLPGFSNWLSLLVLPLLGITVAVREVALRTKLQGTASTSRLAVAAAFAAVYGAALSASFLFGLEQLSLVLFGSLFLISVALPVYRAEYILGFVVGMTIAFGSVIPLVFAVVFATLSYVARRVVSAVVSAIRKPRR